MSKKLFTDKEVNKLRKNPNVKRVSEKAITYTEEFKIRFIEEYEEGKAARKIFEEAGFDVDVITISRVKGCAKRWSKAVKESGTLGLRDGRKQGGGRPITRELSDAEKLKKAEAKIMYLEGELEFIKKLELSEKQNANGKLRPELAFQLIEELSEETEGLISTFCELAGVSRSGYYAYLKSEARKKRETMDLHLKELIEDAINYRNPNKGTRSIVMLLRNKCGIIINRKCVQRICRKYGLLSSVRKANPYRRMAKATKEHSVVSNRLKREFKPGVAGKVLLTDVTYLPYGNGAMAYLSTIKDSQTNEILAHQLSSSLEIKFVLETVKDLKRKHKSRLHPEAFIHSDQGSHYTSPKFQKELKKLGLGQSMSRRGNCWDNAPMESFFGHMKDENAFSSCQSFKELESMIDEYMDYYNNDRGQWNLKKLTPVMYRNQLELAS